MVGVFQHFTMYEVLESGRLLATERSRIAHQHQAVGLERPAERGVDIQVGIGHEAVALVESLSANRNFILRGIDLQNDPARFTACLLYTSDAADEL